MQESTHEVRTARVAAALVVVLVPAALVVSGLVGRALGRGTLVLAVVAAVVCLAASLRLVRRGAHAWSLVLGTVSFLGGAGYLWSVRNVEAAIPVAGFLAVLLGLVLLVAGGLTLRPAGPRVT